MKPLEEIAFEIISSVGSARSSYIMAIDLAEEGKVEEALESIEEGKEFYNEGHKAHKELLTLLANGELPSIDLLLAHAEDQLMSAETFGILAERFVKLYKKLNVSE